MEPRRRSAGAAWSVLLLAVPASMLAPLAPTAHVSVSAPRLPRVASRSRPLPHAVGSLLHARLVRVGDTARARVLASDATAEEAAEVVAELEVDAWDEAFESPIRLRRRLASVRRLLLRLRRARELRILFDSCRPSPARDELDFDGLVRAMGKLGMLFGNSFVPPEPAVLRHLLDDDGRIQYNDFRQLAQDVQADAISASSATNAAVSALAPSASQLLAQRTRSRARPAALRALARVAKGAEERGLTWREMFDM